MRWRWIRLRTLPALLAAVAVASCGDGAGTPVEPPSFTHTSRELQKVEGPIPEFRVEKVIGPEGGSLGVSDFTLTVPRGAVAHPTRFVFESVASGYVEVRLTATSLYSRELNNVGKRGFSVPLSLSFSYHSDGWTAQFARLVVAWVADDGRLVQVPTSTYPYQRVIVGRLSHFSQYVVASD